MPIAPWSWRSRRPRPPGPPLLALEWLEDRTLLSGNTLQTATLLTFGAFQTAQATGFVADPHKADLYEVALNADDRISVSVSAQAAGGGLQSLLRIFNSQGTPLALDNQESGDPSLTFQAATAGDYFIGVSSAPDDDYNPLVAETGSSGGTTGLYTLNLRLTTGLGPQADLTGSSFRLGVAAATAGESVPVSFTVENRGALAPGNFQVELLLANNDLFDASAEVVRTFTPAELTAAGDDFSSPAGLTITVPAGLASGPLFVGLRIIPDTGVPDAGLSDKSGVHRGEDWETLTVLTPVQAGVTKLSSADATLNTQATGTLTTAAQVDTYSFTVPTTPVSGSLSASVTAVGGAFAPRLTLYGSNGQVLIQSDSGTLTQVLPQGSYTLAVSSQSGTGSYQLTTEYVSAGPALQPSNVGTYPNTAVVAADLNGDGKPDLVTTNAGDGTVSVLLGNGDDTFQPAQSIPVGAGPVALAVADVNGDGKPDLVVVNSYQTVAFGPVTNGSFTLTFAGDTTGALAYDAGPLAVQQELEALPVVKAAGPGGVVVTGSPGAYHVTFFLPGMQVPLLSATSSLLGPAPAISVSAVGEVTVLLGKGDGTFGAPQTYPVGMDPTAVAVADVNGDGIPDLIVTNQGDNTISVLLGNGNGTFAPAQSFAVGLAPLAVAAADLNGDGRPDLVVANSGGGTVTVLTNTTTRGSAAISFHSAAPLTVGQEPIAVALADVNSDGNLDLVVTTHVGATDSGTGNGQGTVSVLLGNGNGTFGKVQTIMVGSGPTAAFDAGPAGVAVADLNNDGQLDLVAVTQGDYTVTALLNTTTPRSSNVSFVAQPIFALDALIDSVTVADVNGDGKPDFIGAYSRYYGTVPVLLGNGDGSFQRQPTFRVGSNPDAVAVADLTGDGKDDIVTVDEYDNTVSVLLGNGDGSFQPRQSFPVGPHPVAVAVADLNGDGIPDLVVANAGNDTVSVLLGNGDGSFQPQQIYDAGPDPTSVAVADLTGDGLQDIIVADGGDGELTVLLGNGDGTFGMARTFAVGSDPAFVTVAGGNHQPDVNGDGKPDLVVANKGDDTVSVLLNTTPAGATVPTFAPRQTFAVGIAPVSVAVADVNDDGKPDLVVANQGSDNVSVLTNTTPPGATTPTFATQQTFTVGAAPTSVAVADFDGDGQPDFAVANKSAYSISVLQNLTPQGGTPKFANQQVIATAAAGLKLPYALAAADVNGDGIPDLVVANKYGDDVSVLLGTGDGQVTVSTATNAVGLSSTPYLEDLDGDGIPDLIVLDSAGDILFRKGLGNNQFQAPVTLNTGHPARDLTVFQTATGWAIATADALHIPHTLTYTVSVYTLDGNDHVTASTLFTTTSLPTHIVAGDLTGDGLKDDLVVVDALGDPTQGIDGTIQVALHTDFSQPVTLDTGSSPAGVTLADVNGDGLLDIAVTNQASGDVSIFLNDASHSFTTSYLLRADPDPADVAAATSSVIESDAASVSVAAGDFTGDGNNDLVVVNRGAHSFTVLANNDQGGFANPQVTKTTSTSDGTDVNEQPGPVVAGYFSGPNEPLDLAILMEDTDQVWIFTGHGDGTFTHTSTFPVGPLATGLNAVPVPGTELFDLLVGNQFGDVLTLLGQGDGTFEFPGDQVPLAVQTLADGQPDVLLADQATNEVTLQTAPPGSVQFQQVATSLPGSGPQTVLAPGAVTWFNLEGFPSQFPDAVVVASGSNDVLVYHFAGFAAGGQPTFAPPQVYPVGTDPVSVTIAYVAGETAPEMFIADQGSNDVATLFGSLVSGEWLGTPGPRLKTGGSGPVAVNVVGDAGSPGGNDLVVTNGQSGTMTLLPGVGQGFFNDQNPQPLAIPGPGNTPIRVVSFAPHSDQGVAVLDGGRSVIGINLDDPAASGNVLFTSAAQPVTAILDLGGGKLALAEQDGTVAILDQEPAGLTEEELSPLTDLPTSFLPSALAVLGDEVLVTSAGENQVFVFEPPATFLPGESSALPPQVPGAAVPETTTPGAAPLAAVVTLTVSLAPLPTTGSTEVGAEGEVPAVATGSQVAANVGGDAAGSGPNVLIQGASDDTDEPPDEPAAPDSNFGLGLEEKLRQLELPKTDDGKPDGPSSRRAPGEWPSGPDAADFWQAAGADWLAELPLDAWPAAAEVGPLLPASSRLGGGKELPPAADTAGAAFWPSLPDEVIEAVRQTGGLSRLDREQPLRGTDPAPAKELVPAPREAALPAEVVALAVAGLAFWVEKKGSRQSGESGPDRGAVKDRPLVRTEAPRQPPG